MKQLLVSCLALVLCILVLGAIHPSANPHKTNNANPSIPSDITAMPPSPQCSDLTGNDELQCVMRVVTAPDDGIPVQSDRHCVDQPTADSEARCVEAKYPPPTDPNDGAAWCTWQRAMFTEIDVNTFSCTWNGRDY